MKTIKAMQTEQRQFIHLEKGMIVAEGVIVELNPQTHMYYTPSSEGLQGYWMEPGSTVTVLARVTDGMVKTLQEALKTSTNRP